MPRGRRRGGGAEPRVVARCVARAILVRQRTGPRRAGIRLPPYASDSKEREWRYAGAAQNTYAARRAPNPSVKVLYGAQEPAAKRNCATL
jgi:hypothetical protein